MLRFDVCIVVEIRYSKSNGCNIFRLIAPDGFGEKGVCKGTVLSGLFSVFGKVRQSTDNKN